MIGRLGHWDTNSDMSSLRVRRRDESAVYTGSVDGRQQPKEALARAADSAAVGQTRKQLQLTVGEEDRLGDCTATFSHTAFYSWRRAAAAQRYSGAGSLVCVSLFLRLLQRITKRRHGLTTVDANAAAMQLQGTQKSSHNCQHRCYTHASGEQLFTVVSVSTGCSKHGCRAYVAVLCEEGADIERIGTLRGATHSTSLAARSRAGA